MRIFLCLALLITTVQLFGQSDKIYLKEGGIIRGKIHSEEISDTLNIIVSGHLVSVPIVIIEEIHPHPKIHPDFEKYKNLSYSVGWSTTLSGGTLLGKQSSTAPTKIRPYLMVSEVYRQHPLINLGVGAGVFAYQDFMVYPVFLEYFVTTGKSRNTLIAYGNAGIGLASASKDPAGNTKVSGGAFYKIGLGWQKKVAANFLQLKIGYAIQEIEETLVLDNSYTIIQARTINRIALQVNYSFMHRAK